MSRDDRGQGKPRGKGSRKARAREARTKAMHLEPKYDLLGHDTNDLTNCDRKKRYKTKQSAKEAVNLAKRNGWKRYAYACTICRGFHLTKQDPATARRIRRGWTGSRAMVHEAPAPLVQTQEIDPPVQIPESDHPFDEVLLVMTNEADAPTGAVKTDKHADIARAAGYASAEELGEPSATLDALCRECHLAPMVLGNAKFYPAEDVKKELAARAVPEGMVAAIDWARERGVDRNRVPNAIRDGKYPGRSHYGKPPGMTGKARYYILPEEAAEWCGLNKKPEPEPRHDTITRPAPGSWLSIDEASRVTGRIKSFIRELGDRGEIDMIRENGMCTVSWDDLYEHLRSQVPPAETLDIAAHRDAATRVMDAAPAAPAPVVVNEDVLRMVREANERQREMHSKLLELVEQQKALESRIDAKLAAGAAVWKKTVAERDAAHAQSIADAVAQALDEFERGRRRVA